MQEREKKCLLAVADGQMVPLAQVSDEVFAAGMLGEGYAIEPSAGTIYSPVEGSVVSVSETLHAYTLASSDGLDILIHVGLDTVSLRGEGFVSLVRAGERVSAGDILATVDLALLRERGLETVTPVVISNREALEVLDIATGEVKGGRSGALYYKNRKG